MLLAIQIVGILFALFMIYYAYLTYKRKEFKIKEFLVWAIFWLIFMIITNSLIAILYLFAGDMIAQNLSGEISNSMLFLLAALGIANIVFSVMLFNWKKHGFWGFVLTSIAALVINLSIGLGIGQSLLGCLNPL